MDYLIKEIKKKKELAGIPDYIIKEIIEKKLGANTIPLNKKDIKIFIKDVRSDLRGLVGRFTISKNYLTLMEEGKTEQIIKAHKSTRERLDFYPNLKKIISSFNPNSIIDIGCGLNPIALADKKHTYYASDIDESSLNLVKTYFKKKGVKGKVWNQDIRKGNFPKADLCLILKVFDILKLPHRKVSEILSSIDSKVIIASFPTITLSGKPMFNKRRYWFERIINALSYKYEIIESSNELFYIILKSK